MPTNLAIDDQLIENARRIGRHKTKKAAVTEAIIEYIQRREQLKILGLFADTVLGLIQDENLNYDELKATLEEWVQIGRSQNE